MKTEEIATIRRRVKTSARLLKVMANENRLLVLCQLSEGEKSVGDLVEALGLRQSGLSQHLSILRLEKLVKVRRAGTTQYYSIVDHPAKDLLRTLCQIREN